MSLRLFTALTIPGDIAEGLSRFMRGVDGAAWRPVENLHITLAFYGALAEPDARDLDSAIEEATAAICPFSLALKGAGSFGKEEPSALWMGVEDKKVLRDLSAACVRAARRINVPVETRKYTPHVTMAYLRGTTPDQAERFTQRHGLYHSRPWTVDRFGLFSSTLRRNGPSLYLEEAAYPLRG
jgi:2'-5' RNA ligase